MEEYRTGGVQVLGIGGRARKYLLPLMELQGRLEDGGRLGAGVVGDAVVAAGNGIDPLLRGA